MSVAAAEPAVSAEQALQRLLEGNQRYMSGRLAHPNQAIDRRLELVSGEQPFAVILGCADSRMPVEMVFDQGLGDLFVVRVAGNLANDAPVLGSLEYAVEQLHVPLVVVMGHSKCGAVAAACDVVTKGVEAPGHIGALADAIRPAVEHVRNSFGDLVDNAVRANVEMVVWQIKNAKPLLAEFIHAGKVKVVGARYDLDSGRVDIIIP